MNPEQMLKFKPKSYANLLIDGVIGVRSAVANGEGWSCVPAMSVSSLIDSDQIISLNLPTTIQDDLSVLWLRSRKDSSSNVKVISKWLAEI